MASQRRGWVAFLLSLLLPGVGQLYALRGRRAVAVLLLFPAVSLAVLTTAVLLPVRGVNLGLGVVLGIGLHVAVALDAMRCARGARAQVVPAYARWYGWLGAVVVAAAVNALWVRASRTSLTESYRNVAGSMQNTILQDERILAVKWAYGWREPITGRPLFGARGPRRGELAVFRYPEDRTRPFIKRVIGLPGETIEIRGKTVLIDGRALVEPYAVFLDPPGIPDPAGGYLSFVRQNYGPEVIPRDSYFVLGDNRDNSRDSRFWGMVPEPDFVGRVAVVYWSWDGDAGAVRWPRMGQRLE